MENNIDNIYDEIAKVAHELYEKSGRVHGRDVQNWLEAERIVLARYEKDTKKKKPIKSSKALTKKGK
ncbi:MAG TPA: DUF2934 domain-containing protein [Nitrospirota bacterium]|nr:DUF2934 domain-containing protein [Nitrospirota bacterium]